MAKKPSSGYTSLAHHFLVALPGQDDPNFSKAVVYIYEHNEDGAMGLVINKPLTMHLDDVLQHLNITAKSKTVATQAVMMGGPIGQEHGFVLYEEDGDVFLSSSKETLVEIANDKGPEHYLVALGYAGWQAGQLEIELQHNHYWLIVPGENSILFEMPVEERWRATARMIGVDIERMSTHTGHA